MRDKCGRPVGDKCKLMRPRTPRVKDKCGRRHWEPRQAYTHAAEDTQSALVSHSLGRMILHLSPTCPLHLGALGRMSLHLSSTWLPHLFFTLGVLGRMIYTCRLVTCLPLGVLGRMILHLSPHLSPMLVSHSGCLGPHEFTLVFHLSPTLVPCLPLLGPFSLWVSWAA